MFCQSLWHLTSLSLWFVGLASLVARLWPRDTAGARQLHGPALPSAAVEPEVQAAAAQAFACTASQYCFQLKLKPDFFLFHCMCDVQFIHSCHWLNWFELYVFHLILAQACIGHVAIPSFIRQATWTLVRATGKEGIFSGDHNTPTSGESITFCEVKRCCCV